MPTTEEVIKQAISDFDSIESAIEEMGVDVPAGTDTSEYGNLIRSIAGVGKVDQDYNPESMNAQSGIAVAEALRGLPIKYVEGSSNADETTYLRDLESGTYVLKGTFKPYVGSGTVCRFSSNLLVNVVKGTLNKVPTSHIQIFYPVNNVVQFCDITDESYKRTDIKLNELASATTVEEMIAAANKAAQNIYGNALKANASGEVIRVDDVSPIEHTVKAKVSGKNLLPTNFSVGHLTLDGALNTDVDYRSVFVSLKKGIYTMSTDANVVLMRQMTNGTVVSLTHIFANGNYSFEIAQDSEVGFSFRLEPKGGWNNTVGIQLELGDTATEYEPYIDPTTVTVTRCGKNLFEKVNQTQEKNGVSVTTNEDGSITLNGTATDTVLLYCITAGQKKQLSAGKYALGVGVNMPEKVALILEHYNGDAWLGVIGRVTSTLKQNVDLSERSGNLACYIKIESGATFQNLTLYPQLEKGDIATEFEEYNGTTYTPTADGTCEIVSVSPTMTLLTDTAGANIEIEYNQDNNAFADNVKSDLRELDKVTAELTAEMGDIDTALDAIIAIQENLIGFIEFELECEDDAGNRRYEVFRALRGMTWGEWIGSRYDESGGQVYIDEEGAVSFANDDMMLYEADNSYQYSHTVIEHLGSYSHD